MGATTDIATTGISTPLELDSTFGIDEDQAVPYVAKELVHRRHADQVLLTGIRQVEEHTFTVTARWPGGHQFHGPVTGAWSDPQLLIETIRQAGLLLCHESYALPLKQRFVLQGVSCAADEEKLLPQFEPTDLRLEVSCAEVQARGDVLKGMRMTAEVYRDEERVGVGTLPFTCLPPPVYARLRGEVPFSDDPGLPALPAPVSSWSVGRVRSRDVLLAPTAWDATWELRVERDHPVIYDHPLDHVSGMAIIESMRQAAQLATGLPLAQSPSLETSFTRYVEHSTPCLITTGTPEQLGDGRVAVSVQALQDGTEAARGKVVLRPVAGDAA